MDRTIGDQFGYLSGQPPMPGRIIGSGSLPALQHPLFLDPIDLKETQVRIGLPANVEGAVADKIRIGMVKKTSAPINGPCISTDTGSNPRKQRRKEPGQVQSENKISTANGTQRGDQIQVNLRAGGVWSRKPDFSRFGERQGIDIRKCCRRLDEQVSMGKYAHGSSIAVPKPDFFDTGP